MPCCPDAAPMQVGCERIYLIIRPVQPQCRAVADRYVYRSSRAASARQNVANDKQANTVNTLYGKVYDRRIKHKKPQSKYDWVGLGNYLWMEFI